VQHHLYDEGLDAYREDPEKTKVCLSNLYTSTSACILTCQRRQVIMEARGDYLLSKSKFVAAALCGSDLFTLKRFFQLTFMGSSAFSLAGAADKAITAHLNATQWQEAFTLALIQGTSPEQLAEMAEEVAGAYISVPAVEVWITSFTFCADDLKSKHRQAEAARVLLEYGKDVYASIHTLCQAGEFVEAMRIVSLFFGW
jgi:hypothetical protein